MFEQELKSPESSVEMPPASAAEQGTDELFGKYEIKPWEFNPRIYKILGGSLLLNLLVFTVFTQTNLLTMKGCNSPFVSRVCQVLDTVYVGAMIYGTDRDFIDAEYERSDFSQSEITFVDLSGQAPPLTYPDGYFQIANPEGSDDLASVNDPLGMNNLPGFPPPSRGGNMLASKPNLPKPNKNAVTGDEVDSPFTIESDDVDKPKSGRPLGGKPNANATANSNTNKPDDKAVAQNNTNTNDVEPEIIDPNSIVINRRPLTELGERVIDLQEQGQVDLKSNFTIVAQGRIDKSGRLDPRSFRYQIDNEKTDDKVIGQLAIDSLQTINDAGFLAYLSTLNGQDLKLTLVQDDENITALIETQTTTEADARTKSSGLSGLLSLAKLSKRNPQTQNQKDDLMLLESIKVENTGRSIKINFNIDKDAIHPMLERILAEQAAEMKKPSGNAMHNQNNRLAMIK